MTPDGPAEYFVLDNYGDFQIGDSVMVVGLVDVECETVCPDGDACIINNTIDFCNGDIPPDTISGCGVLVQSGECVLFALEAATLKFTLNNYGGFQPGDSAYVEGYVYWGEDSVCVESDGYIDNWLIEACGGDPGVPFQSCGLLVQGENCVMFAADGFGDTLFVLENHGVCQVGNSVHVDGLLDTGCETICIGAFGCIWDNTIGPCDNPLDTVTLYGVLVQGTNCVLFDPPTFSIYDKYALDNYGSFQVGDSVVVTGFLDPDCVTVCIDADACILDNTIEAWDSNPGTYYEAYGYLYGYGECIVFLPFNAYYEEYVLDNYGDFQPYDTVFVTGTMYSWCPDICTDTGGCIVDNTIEWAGFPDSATAPHNSEITDVINYPNPFNPAATISFNLTAPSRVTLTIYNILGQNVETLIDNELLDGPQTAKWNGDKFASGIYFYRIKTDYEVITKKMSLSK